MPLATAFLTTSMPVGGAETLLVNLVRRFDRQMIAPEIVCLKEPGPLGIELRSQCPVHERFLSCKWDLRVLPRLVRLFRSRQYQAIVTVGAGDKMFWGRCAARLAKTPVVLSALHSTGWPDHVTRLNRLLTPITDGFIAVAENHARHLIEVEKFPAAKVHTIRNGVDTDRFKPDALCREELRAELGIASSTPLVGIVAALRPEKNHWMFLRVATRVVEKIPNARFLIVGDGAQRQSLEAEIARLNLQHTVCLLGNRADTPRLLAALDLFLLCSRNEASPVSILESLSSEVPVIATRVGSVPEMVVPGETGELVEIDDDQAMAEAAIKYLRCPRDRATHGRCGRARVIERGSLTTMVHDYTRLIETIHQMKKSAQTDRRIGSGVGQKLSRFSSSKSLVKHG